MLLKDFKIYATRQKKKRINVNIKRMLEKYDRYSSKVKHVTDTINILDLQTQSY